MQTTAKIGEFPDNFIQKNANNRQLSDENNSENLSIFVVDKNLSLKLQ